MVSNFFELGLVYSTNLLLPLVVTPYLMRTVGVERVGVIALAQAIVGFLTVLTDYGFSLTAVREVSIHRDKPGEMQRVWSEVMAIKMGLCLAGVAVLGGITVGIPDFYKHRDIFVGAAVLLVGQALLPTWFFQGLEWVRPLTVLNATSKLLAGLLMLAVVRRPDDAVFVNWLLGLSSLLPALVGIGLIRRKFHLALGYAGWAAVKQRLFSGLPVFLSGLSINLYVNSNVIVLRFFADNTTVGYYSVVERLILALRQPCTVFFQVTYPRACKLAVEDARRLPSFYRRYFLPLLLFNALLGVGLFLGDTWILRYLLGEAMPEAIQILHSLSWVPLIVSLNIPFYQLLLIGEHRYVYSGILTAGAFLCIGLNTGLAPGWGAMGTAWAVLMAEVSVTLALFISAEHKYRHRTLLQPNSP